VLETRLTRDSAGSSTQTGTTRDPRCRKRTGNGWVPQSSSKRHGRKEKIGGSGGDNLKPGAGEKALRGARFGLKPESTGGNLRAAVVADATWLGPRGPGDQQNEEEGK